MNNIVFRRFFVLICGYAHKVFGVSTIRVLWESISFTMVEVLQIYSLFCTTEL